ncbi:MAG: ATP synthase F1 subunit epsilon [Candidatus Magasanikbacteria bacterium]|jgi:F-type H+-transporting ATPase subunit epsilon|nr:ATP synthase F1 subunit epsilon [Candidatus Magasanikbacteria bacterium]MBT4071661.1 ATP synthase F1 subunit epsilon [Candidatus Magasanikbacteria bacterium]
MMPFNIVTPEGVIYKDDVLKVTVPTEAGEVTILENHAPMVSILKAGELHIYKDDQIISMAVSTGFIEIRPTGELYIIADTAERATDIDIERAETAKKRAEELLKQQQDINDIDFARIQASLERAITRIGVGNTYK